MNKSIILIASALLFYSATLISQSVPVDTSQYIIEELIFIQEAKTKSGELMHGINIQASVSNRFFLKNDFWNNTPEKSLTPISEFFTQEYLEHCFYYISLMWCMKYLEPEEINPPFTFLTTVSDYIKANSRVFEGDSQSVDGVFKENTPGYMFLFTEDASGEIINMSIYKRLLVESNNVIKIDEELIETSEFHIFSLIVLLNYEYYVWMMFE